jgi:hypothetical protein
VTWLPGKDNADNVTRVELLVAVTLLAVPVVLNAPVPVRLVTTPDDGVPRAGVTKVGLVANTRLPVPVAFDMIPASCADVVLEKKLRLFAEVAHVAQAGTLVRLTAEKVGDV